VNSRDEDESVPAHGEQKPPRTVARFSPFSLPRVSEDARLRLRLARLQLEAQEKESCRIQSQVGYSEDGVKHGEPQNRDRDSSRKRGEAKASRTGSCEFSSLSYGVFSPDASKF